MMKIISFDAVSWCKILNLSVSPGNKCVPYEEHGQSTHLGLTDQSVLTTQHFSDFADFSSAASVTKILFWVRLIVKKKPHVHALLVFQFANNFWILMHLLSDKQNTFLFLVNPGLQCFRWMQQTISSVISKSFSSAMNLAEQSVLNTKLLFNL